MSPRERMRRLEEKIDADFGDNEAAHRIAFASWLETLSDDDLDRVEGFVVKMEGETGAPYQELWLQCADYDEVMQMIREQSEASNEG